MVLKLNEYPDDNPNNKKLVFGTCLSTDDKPMNVFQGSALYEEDTHFNYIYFNDTWVLLEDKDGLFKKGDAMR